MLGLDILGLDMLGRFMLGFEKLGLDVLGRFMPGFEMFGLDTLARDALPFEPLSIPAREGLLALGRGLVLALEGTVDTTGLRVTDPVLAGPPLAGTRVPVTALVDVGRGTARPTAGAR